LQASDDRPPDLRDRAMIYLAAGELDAGPAIA